VVAGELSSQTREGARRGDVPLFLGVFAVGDILVAIYVWAFAPPIIYYWGVPFVLFFAFNLARVALGGGWEMGDDDDD
jgi:hypothetical protein